MSVDPKFLESTDIETTVTHANGSTATHRMTVRRSDDFVVQLLDLLLTTMVSREEMKPSPALMGIVIDSLTRRSPLTIDLTMRTQGGQIEDPDANLVPPEIRVNLTAEELAALIKGSAE